MVWRIFRRSKNESGRQGVGLAVVQDELIAVACEGEVDGRPHLVAWERFPFDPTAPAEAGRALQDFVEANDLQNWSCRCTLSPGDYSLRLVERPTNVPDEELIDATRWLVRDLVEFDVEEAQLGILTIPEDGNRARTPRMFVVVARHEPIMDLAHLIDGVGLRLAGFDIVESSMLALESRMPEVVAGSASLRVDDKASVLTVSRHECLFLARNLHVDADAIETAAQNALQDPDGSDSGIMDLLDSLLLDIQRSLDYYESEYGQAAPSRLTLFPSPVDFSPLIPTLSEVFRPLQVEAYDLTRYFEVPEPLPTSVQPVVALAGGSAIADPGLLGDSLVPAVFRGLGAGFGLPAALRIVAAAALLFGAISSLSWTRLGEERIALAELEAEHDRLTKRVETLRAEEARRVANAADPRSRIEALRAARDARLALLRDLGQSRNRPEASFSNLLAGLARQDLDDLWLERIEITEGGDAIALEGRSLRPEDVPILLRRLGTEKGFESRDFRTFEIERRNDSLPGVAFRIATREEESPSGGGAP